MNAAAKQINQTTLFNGRFLELHFSRTFFTQMLLLASLFISAIAVVYSTNGYRLAQNQLQSAEQYAHRLQLQSGQLLLETSSLRRASRIQELAAHKLGMVIAPQVNMLKV